MLVSYELELADRRRIITDVRKDIKEIIAEQINNKDISLHVSRVIDKAIAEQFDSFRNEIQELVREEVKIQLKEVR